MAINSKAKNLTGQKFGYWVVLSRDENKNKHGHRMFICRCVCGSEKSLRGSMLTSGGSISCGCMVSKDKNKTHDMSYTRTYKSWSSMKQRCFNKKNSNYPAYGAKGITVCERWINSFENFLSDMGERPKNTTLDRVDVNGDYEPSNCRWATPMEQTLNRSETVWFEYNGETLCLEHLVKKYKITKTMLLGRLERGMSLHDAITTPHQKLQYEITFNGVVYNQTEFFKKFGLSSTSSSRDNRNGVDYIDGVKRQLIKKGIVFNESSISVVKKPYGKRLVIEL